jgi:hypothetical protein
MISQRLCTAQRLSAMSEPFLFHQDHGMTTTTRSQVLPPVLPDHGAQANDRFFNVGDFLAPELCLTRRHKHPDFKDALCDSAQIVRLLANV